MPPAIDNRRVDYHFQKIPTILNTCARCTKQPSNMRNLIAVPETFGDFFLNVVKSEIRSQFDRKSKQG